MNKFTRKNFLKTFGAALSVPSVFSAVNFDEPPNTDAPNFVVMMTDDSSPFSYHAYGNQVLKTPNLDRFAEEGMRFNRGYCTSPQCSPARASVLTGQMPCRVFASRLHSAVPEKIVNMANLLNQNGYYTGAIGKVHQPVIKGDFQFYSNYQKHSDGDEPFSTFFDKRPDHKPFFLHFGSWNPHRPYNSKTIKYSQKHNPDEINVPDFLPDTPKVRQDLAYYYDKLFLFDKKCGMILSMLEKQNLADNTIVVQTSDHGMPFPRAKATLYEPGIRVPLIIRWPRKVSSGSVSDALVSTMDLPATFLEAAGIKVPDVMQSRSFLPILTGQKDHIRDYVYAERDWHDSWDPMRCVVGDHYKLIQRYRPEIPYLPCLDLQKSLSYQSILQLVRQGRLQDNLSWYSKYTNSPRPEMAFYDLESDPWEWENLTDGPHQKKNEKNRVYQYQLELSEHMHESYDFLPPPRTAFPGGPDSSYNSRINPLYAKSYK